jgi:hypothetical protein
MSRYSPTVVPWAKDPWEIQAQLVGQYGQARALTDMSKRTKVYERGQDLSEKQHEELMLPAEERAQGNYDVERAKSGYLDPQQMEAYQREQFDTRAAGTGGQTPEVTPIPGGNPMHQGMRTPGINGAAPPLGGAQEPGNLFAQLQERLMLPGGGSIAAPGFTPQEQYDRANTQRTGQARAGALNERGYGIGPEEQKYMGMSGKEVFTPNAQAGGFETEEEYLNWLYESGMLDPTVMRGMIDQDTAGQDRGFTANQVLEQQQTQAINWIADEMQTKGITAQEAWRNAPAFVQQLVTAGQVGQDVYNSGRPGAYGTGAFGQTDPRNPLSAQFNPAATQSVQAVRMGADARVERQKLAATGDVAAVRAFDAMLMQDEKLRLQPWIETGLMGREIPD